jgi:hypothetical protein
MGTPNLELLLQIRKINSLEGIRETQEFLKQRYNQIISNQSNNFFVGQKVFFEARKQIWEGVVQKVNPKSISVLTSKPSVIKWSVSPLHCKTEPILNKED